MSDSNDLEIAFEEPENPEVDVVVLKPGEQAPEEKPVAPAQEPDKVTLTPEEFKNLLVAQQATAGALTQGLSQIGERLATPAQPAPYMPPPPPDPKTLEERAFTPGQFQATVDEIVQSKLTQERIVQAQAAQDMEKRLLKLDPETAPTYKKYEKEIEAMVASAPPQVRFQPNIYQQAYKMIEQQHLSEIIAEKAQTIAQSQIEAGVAAALEKMGIKAPAGAKPGVSGATFSESSPGNPPKPKQKLYLTTADRQDMLESAMDPSDPDAVKAYLKYKKERSGK